MEFSLIWNVSLGASGSQPLAPVVFRPIRDGVGGLAPAGRSGELSMIGRTIAHYLILENLGGGSMGPSLMLAQPRLGRNSFLKRAIVDRKCRSGSRLRVPF